MAGSRYVLFIKLRDSPEWIEHLIFFSRSDAEVHGHALKVCFSGVADYCVVELSREDAVASQSRTGIITSI